MADPLDLDALDAFEKAMTQGTWYPRDFAGDPGEPLETGILCGGSRLITGDGFLLEKADAVGIAAIRNAAKRLIEEAREALAVRSEQGCLFRCRACQVLWRNLPNGTWALADTTQKAGPCCDNPAMGDHLRRYARLAVEKLLDEMGLAPIEDIAQRQTDEKETGRG